MRQKLLFSGSVWIAGLQRKLVDVSVVHQDELLWLVGIRGHIDLNLWNNGTLSTSC